jgi:hypothetical protein
LRWENPPEGAKNLQGYSIHTETHKPQQGFTRFLRIWSLHKREKWEPLLTRTEGEWRTEGVVCSPREGRRGAQSRRSTVGDGGPPVVRDRRWERGSRRGTERTYGEGRTESLWLGRAGGLFLKRDMDAPDSLQCLFGAHRTAHSSCPVNHRTAHRKMDF